MVGFGDSGIRGKSGYPDTCNALPRCHPSKGEKGSRDMKRVELACTDTDRF